MKNLCQSCGHEIIEESLYKPKLYCSSICRDYMKYKNALEKSLLALRPTKEAKKIIKGDMFRLSNSVSNCTNTIKDKNND
ncbi:MAG: hypothetical protein ACI8WT_003143 [Clostridium sp.]|jgi:hypothetical protein